MKPDLGLYASDSDLPIVTVGAGQLLKVGRFPPGLNGATIEWSKDYLWSGLIIVPSGALGVLPPCTVRANDQQYVQMLGIYYLSNTGGATFKLQHNGVDLGAPKTWVTTTSLQSDESSVFPIECTDKDTFQPIVTSISGTPDGLTLGLIFEITV